MARIKSNPHYTFAEKKRVLEALLVSPQYKDKTPFEFSRICNVKYSTLMRWGNAINWDAAQIEKLRRKTRKEDKKKRSGLGEGVESKILVVKKEHPNWGPLKIKQYLWRHEQILAPQTSIYKFLKAKGLVNERQKGGEAGHDRNFEYPCPLAAVQMDLMHVTLSNGQTIYLVTLLDDFSRFALLSRFIAVKTMNEVMDVFKEAIRRYGVMDRLLTDCGAEFVSWQRFTRFEEMLSDLDVGYIASGPDKKENQGKVERWHQTVREELRLRGPLDYSSEAQMWIREIVDMYNFERPNQGIGGLLPADRFFGMRKEIEAELERYRANKGQRLDKQIYFVCRIGERKLVVSGPRPEKVTMRLDGKAIGTGEMKPEEFQLEKKAVGDNPCAEDIQGGNND